MSKTVFLFPSQGSQYVGMGKSIYENFSAARRVFEEANDCLGIDLKELCFSGDLEELTKTENTQPAILTVSFAAYQVFMQEVGIQPDFCAGHSLGEITALTCSGAIRFHDAVKIVRQRGKFMQAASALGMGTMAAVTGVDKAVIVEECQKASEPGDLVVVSNYNSPEQIVISGHKNAVNRAANKLQEYGANVIFIKVSAPFHSPIMEQAALQLEEELKKYEYHSLKYPVISNVDAKAYADPGEIVSKLKAQMVMPVLWADTIKYLESQGVTQAFEIGPKNVLTNLMSKNTSRIQTYPFEKRDDIQTVQSKLGRDEANSVPPKSDITVVTKCLAVAVCLKNRNWDNDEYQRGVVEPYRKVQQMQEKIESERRQPTVEEMKAALAMLLSVFETKKTPEKERVERINQILEQTGTQELFRDFAEYGLHPTR